MSWLPDWLTGYDAENAARGAAAEEERQRLNQLARDAGRYDNATWQQIQRDYASEFDTDPSTIDDAFNEGWKEGRGNVSGFIKETLNKIVADPLRAVVAGLPWWIWAIGLGYVAWRLWPLLRRSE